MFIFISPSVSQSKIYAYKKLLDFHFFYKGKKEHVGKRGKILSTIFRHLEQAFILEFRRKNKNQSKKWR